MATIAQILPEHWAGQQWSIDGDEYGTLEWHAENMLPKPSEAEIRSHSDDVDAILADRAQRARQQRAMIDAPDYLLRAIETIIDGLIETRRVVNDARDTINPAAHSGQFTAWDATVVSRISALRQKIINIRNVP